VDYSFKALVEQDEVHRLAYYVLNKVSTTQVIDARHPDRFLQEVDEPRNGIKRGRFPGSRNLYYRDLMNTEDGTLLSDKKLAGIFHKHGIDTFSTTAVLSGSGISAAVLELAL